MMKELRQFGDIAELMVSQCNDILQILSIIVETIYPSDHNGDGDLLWRRYPAACCPT